MYVLKYKCFTGRTYYGKPNAHALSAELAGLNLNSQKQLQSWRKDKMGVLPKIEEDFTKDNFTNLKTLPRIHTVVA